MNKTYAAIELILPEMRRVLKMITTVIIFSLFLVIGVVISIVEGSFVYDELGYIQLTPLLVSGLVLTGLSALVLGYVFLTKNWAITISKHTTQPPRPFQFPNQRPQEQHGYRPVDKQL